MGKVVSYDSATDTYNAVFEDGHGEDLVLSQLQQLLMAEDNAASGMKVSCRKRMLGTKLSFSSRGMMTLGVEAIF
jgi:hypothetical protein